jgi:hypothetical protein
MNCEQVLSLLVSYLHHEVTPSERRMLQAHLSGCKLCREEFIRMAKTHGRIAPALQRRAIQAAPASDAWERLEARLAEETRPSPARITTWFSHLAPGEHQWFSQLFAGGVTMHKRLILAAGGLALAMVMVAVLILNTASPVSAQVVLDKAYAAQASVIPPAVGVEHIRHETYSNLSGLPEVQGTDTTLESYHDLRSGSFRVVTLDSRTGQVLNVYAYDGAYTYSADVGDAAQPASPLTVHRSPQPRASTADLKPRGGDNGINSTAKGLFDQVRQDPNVQLAGQETWADGRTVFVLRSQQQLKVIVKGELQRPTGDVTVYFDATTYEMLGNRATLLQDGKEILVSSQVVLANEILPEGTRVAWDLSDLAGIAIVDDPDRHNRDLLPEIISEQELSAKTGAGYLLKTIPAGYTLEITVPPKQPANEPFIYIASYRTAANDYFVIQAGAGKPTDDSRETYTTAGGLVLHFMRDISDPAGKRFISALVEAPAGVVFTVTSTLPRETVKAWAEELAVVK